LISSFSSLASHKNIELTFSIPPVRYLTSFDRDKVEAVLINIISNAIKFTPPEGIVTVEASIGNSNQIPPGKEALVLSVRDSGIGIPLNEQSKVFERFYQLNDSHSEVGTGIGLALVKELTELMGGKIVLVSEPAKGSEFILTLPVEIIRVIDDAEIVIPEMVLPLPVPDEDDIIISNGEKPRLLVIEDHVDLRRFIISSLQGQYDFIEAGDGKSGFDMAVEEIPELIITDVMMPGMDGITMTAKLKGDIRTSHIPILILTAKATDESKITGLTSGANDYLTKPFNKAELIIKVRNAISAQVKMREKIRLDLLQQSPKIEAVSDHEQFLQRVKETIQDRLADEDLDVESLAQAVGWSRSQFYRKIKATTGLGVNELIRNFRLQRGAQLLEQRWGSVSQIAYEIGFSSSSYFSKCFKDHFGVHPSEYSKKQQSHV
jgi:DNA-binding response OmpR family regulator